MKKLLVLLLILLSVYSSVFSQRTGEMMIQGKLCSYDTLVHRHIAPGVTLTQFQFNKILVSSQVYKMKAHLIAIDMTNKYNSFTPYLSKDQYFAISTQKQEVKRRKDLGLKPIATMTGGGFIQSNGNLNTATAYEVSGSMVSNGQVKYQDGGSRVNFYVDASRTMHVGKTRLSAYVKCGEDTYTIGQVNHHRDKVDTSEHITLFCNGIPRSNASDTKKSIGIDVRVKLVDADCIKTGKPTKCKVVEVLDGCYHSIANGEAILSGIGAAESYLRKLSIGSEITISLDYVNENGEAVDVQEQLTNLFGYCIKDGVVQEYATKNYAICAIGYSKDGKTCYWADLEISTNSNAPCICLADLMKGAGAYDAMWLDGGPSAEMTVDGEFITTNSIGYGFNGRYIPAGFMIFSEAPQDNTISTIELQNPSKIVVYPNSVVKPVAYGYNQYGEMIDNNACLNSNVEMTCTQGLGTIANGVFTAKNSGSGFIYIKAKSSGETVSIPVEVIKKRKLKITPESLFTGEFRKCQVRLSLIEDGVTTPVNPNDAVWSADGRRTVSSCDGGLVVPYADGKTNVYAEYDGLRDTMRVVVENLEVLVDSIDYTDEIEDASYPEITLRSVPHYFSVSVSGTPETQATIYYSAGETMRSTTIEIPVSGIGESDVVLDYDSIDTYPVTVEYVTGTDNEGRQYEIKRLVSFYKEWNSINSSVLDDTEMMIVERDGKLILRNVSDMQKKGALRIYQTNGALMGEYKYNIAPKSEKAVCKFPDYPFITNVGAK